MLFAAPIRLREPVLIGLLTQRLADGPSHAQAQQAPARLGTHLQDMPHLIDRDGEQVLALRTARAPRAALSAPDLARDGATEIGAQTQRGEDRPCPCNVSHGCASARPP